ncbi:tyrosine-protein phosphatase [Nocardia sp. NPDC057440]|uniref:tyrosine-protein phosphatase n=1 Tax=Nocardia sp. NPDC057440 TaxID=3346134 RepID=UPI00366FD58B
MHSPVAATIKKSAQRLEHDVWQAADALAHQSRVGSRIENVIGAVTECEHRNWEALAEIRRMRLADETDPRWIDNFGKVANVRDFGGLETTDGRRTRSGVLYRSSTPECADADDVDRLVDTLGVRSVIDLRTADEFAQHGHGLLDNRADIDIVNYPISSPVRPVRGQAEFVKLYQECLEFSPQAFVAAARHIINADGAALVHCAHGKDRTGMLIAVLQHAVGVPRKAIQRDFELTNLRLEQIRAIEGIRPPRAAVPQAMKQFLDTLEGVGGGAGYLRTHGLTDGELTSLREVLTTDSIR